MELCTDTHFQSISNFPKDSNNEAVDEFLMKRKHIFKVIKSNLKSAQHKMMQLANKKRSEIVFIMGYCVYLKFQPHRQASLANRVTNKLSTKFYGPYQICERIGVVAYKLELLVSTIIHLVFQFKCLN
jgi:hypothetical protein